MPPERATAATSGDRPAPASVAERLSREIDRSIGELLAPGTRVALVNFPDIDNVGDSAIWLGTRHALDRAGARVAYQCEPGSYSRRLLTGAIGERGTVLIQGGGNLGDVYPNQHAVRERILAELPRARVIQLPQSAWFRTAAGEERFRRLAEAHDDFTIMVRERASLDWARSALSVPALLCPDMALALGALDRDPAELDLLWLMRTDPESRGRPLPPPGLAEAHADWRSAGPLRRSGPRDLRALLAVNRRIGAMLAAHERLGPALRRGEAATFGPIARRRLEVGRRILCRGRVVITDRLHGHLLALLLGIPHVVLDGASGKSRAFWRTWTSPDPLARWADDPDEARTAALELLGRAQARTP